MHRLCSLQATCGFFLGRWTLTRRLEKHKRDSNDDKEYVERYCGSRMGGVVPIVMIEGILRNFRPMKTNGVP